MNRSRIAAQRTQRGVTLVIALLILIMIMMFGVPAAMDSMRNERMTGNTRQRDVSFQAAECAIHAADSWILTETSSSLNAKAPAAKLCPVSVGDVDDVDPVSGDGIFPNGECHANSIDYWRDSASSLWVECITTCADLTQIDTTTPPCYVVERMPDAGTKHYYRITARGVGKDNNAAVILQTMYESD